MHFEEDQEFRDLSEIEQEYKKYNKNNLDGEPKTETSNNNWVYDNCGNEIDLISMEPFSNEMLKNEDLIVIKKLMPDNKFKKGFCELKTNIIEQLKSDRQSTDKKNFRFPSNIKCIWKNQRARQYTERDLLTGICCAPTNELLFKLSDNMIITMQSLIDLLSSSNQVWYAVPMFGGKRKRVGNVYGFKTVPGSDHGQIPGFIIYKLFTKEQIKNKKTKYEENNPYAFSPSDSYLIYPERFSIEDAADSEIFRIIDFLMMYYLIGKKHIKLQKDNLPKPNKYNYIYSDENPKKFKINRINKMINDGDYLPHWLHPKKKYYDYIENDFAPNLSSYNRGPELQAQAPVSQEREFLSTQVREMINSVLPGADVGVPVALTDNISVAPLVTSDDGACWPGYELNARGKCVVKCKSHQIRNPATQRCKNKSKCKNTQELINGKCLKKCKSDQIRNPQTKRCRKLSN